MGLRNHLPSFIRRPLGRLRAAVTEVVRAGAQPVLTLRLLTGRNLRRAEPRAWSRLFAASLAALGIVGTGVVLAVVASAWWIALVFLLPFVVSRSLQAWRARARRGAADGWAPGRIGRGPGWLLGPDWFARQAARHGRVFTTNFYDVPTVCVVDFGAGAALLREHVGDLGPPWGPYERFVPGGSVRGATGDRHAELRRSYARALGPEALPAWEPTLATAARRCLETLADACDHGPVNPREAVRTCVVEAWMEVLLGVQPSEALRAQLDRLDPDRRFYADELADAVVEHELEDVGRMVVANARSDTGGSAPQTLARRFDDDGARRLDDPGVLRNLIYTVLTSRDDVAGLLVWVLWYVAAHPEWAPRLLDAGVHGADTANYVSEVLRLEQSEFLMRRATAAVDHTGPAGRIVVPDGWFLRVCTREIHRDDANFPDAERFDPDRFAVDLAPRSRTVYAPFGIDHRACLGERLTRTFAQVFAVETARWQLTTVADGPPELSRQRHWSPSDRWRLRVAPPAVSR